MKAFLLVIRNLLQFYCGPSDGGRYDMTGACPICGTGAKRLDPIKLPVARIRNRVFNTLKFEVIIPPRLVPQIRRIAPQCLRVVCDKKTNTDSLFHELIPEKRLPRWGARTSGWVASKMDPPCYACLRDGYYNEPHVPLCLSYDEPVSPFHVASTYECFGRSVMRTEFRKSLFSPPYLVVSETIKNILSNERNLEFEPVEFHQNR